MIITPEIRASLRHLDADDAIDRTVEIALEAAAKIPRQYALELADGAFGQRFPEEATAICNASTNMADRILALKEQK
jgi:Ran GTPase-activating protein (RanGAP) involved in mRNA processing and transport